LTFSHEQIAYFSTKHSILIFKVNPFKKKRLKDLSKRKGKIAFWMQLLTPIS